MTSSEPPWHVRDFEPTDAEFQAIANLRNAHYYPTRNDERYRGGGVHSLLSAAQLAARHRSNSDSRHSGVWMAGTLLAYSRYVVSSPEATLEIIAISPDGMGLSDRRAIVDGLMNHVLERIAAAGSRSVLSLIAIYPVVNVASLGLHYRRGFVPAADILPSFSFGGEDGGELGWIKVRRTFG